ALRVGVAARRARVLEVEGPVALGRAAGELVAVAGDAEAHLVRGVGAALHEAVVVVGADDEAVVLALQGPAVLERRVDAADEEAEAALHGARALHDAAG